MKYVYKFILDGGVTFDAGSNTDPVTFRKEFAEHQHDDGMFYLECSDPNGRLVTFDFRPAAVRGFAIIPQETVEAANRAAQGVGPKLHLPN